MRQMPKHRFCWHSWRVLRLGMPVNDGYGHIAWARYSKCRKCGKEKWR